MEESFNCRLFSRATVLTGIGTSISCALLYLALFKLLSYCSQANMVEQYDSQIKIAAAILLFVLQHVIFKAENNWSNNFIGRVFHDMLFFVLFVLIVAMYGFLQGHDVLSDLGGFGTSVLIVLTAFLGFMAFELTIALLKRLLKLVGWQIL
jgi:hypothetical protein